MRDRSVYCGYLKVDGSEHLYCEHFDYYRKRSPAAFVDDSGNSCWRGSLTGQYIVAFPSFEVQAAALFRLPSAYSVGRKAVDSATMERLQAIKTSGLEREAARSIRYG